MHPADGTRFNWLRADRPAVGSTAGAHADPRLVIAGSGAKKWKRHVDGAALQGVNVRENAEKAR